MALGVIVNVSGRCDDGVHQTGLRIHHGARIGPRCMRRNVREQIGPGHNVAHLFERDLPARVSGIEVKAEACLFHVNIVSNLHAKIELAGVGV